jgi:putative transposase
MNQLAEAIASYLDRAWSSLAPRLRGRSDGGYSPATVLPTPAAARDWFEEFEKDPTWERLVQTCAHILSEEGQDTYALAALRYLDRTPMRAGLVNDPTTYPWSSCAAYALGTPNRVLTLHPSYLVLSPYAKVRQRQYCTLLAPSEDPRADARDPRWSTQRAVGSPTFMAPYVPRRGRRRIGTMPSQNQEVRP